MTAEYTYDIYGRRIKKSVNNEVTHFLWEDDNIGLELNGSLQPVRRYVYGVGIDSAEGHFEYSENPTNPFSLDKKGWYSYVKDQVGTIYKTYNHFTRQTTTTTFDSFGNTLNQSGTKKGNLGFQSKYRDPESGLYYYYHRYYNPLHGRFINEDPIGLNGGLNLSQFVGNDPINYLDPFGEKCTVTGALSYTTEPNVTISDSKFKFRIHPKKLGIGGFERKVSMKLNVKGRIVCQKNCGNHCPEEDKTWHIPFSHTFEKKFIVGTGFRITNKYIAIINLIDAGINVYNFVNDIYLKYREPIESSLDYLKQQNVLLGIVCELRQ